MRLELIGTFKMNLVKQRFIGRLNVSNIRRIARELIKVGADLNIQDNDGYTVLHKAIFCKNINKRIKNLTDAAGTNLNIQDNDGPDSASLGCVIL